MATLNIENYKKLTNVYENLYQDFYWVTEFDLKFVFDDPKNLYVCSSTKFSSYPFWSVYVLIFFANEGLKDVSKQ